MIISYRTIISYQIANFRQIFNDPQNDNNLSQLIQISFTICYSCSLSPATLVYAWLLHPLLLPRLFDLYCNESFANK
jgi:hypothetical protein